MTTMSKVWNFENQVKEWRKRFLEQAPLMTGEWQSQDISDKPMLATRELLNESFTLAIPESMEELQKLVSPNLPWAEDHFGERISGEPLNPPPSEAWWPFAQQGNKDAKEVGLEKFSHTYPERMWPKWAGPAYEDMAESNSAAWEPMHGIRYRYGDLEDVVDQLVRGPLTRQAYLPIWFPEDTGAVEGQRVPCTLGYHFLVREGRLQITYYIRSCDFIRHFRDDVYMAARLAQYVAYRVNEERKTTGPAEIPEASLQMGGLVMHIVSFHIFEGDVAMLERQVAEDEQVQYANLASLL